MVSIIKALSQKQNEELMNADLRQIKAKIIFLVTQLDSQETVKDELIGFHNRITEIIALPITLKAGTFQEVNEINKLVNDLLKFNKLNLSFCDIKSNNMAY